MVEKVIRFELSQKLHTRKQDRQSDRWTGKLNTERDSKSIGMVKDESIITSPSTRCMHSHTLLPHAVWNIAIVKQWQNKF